MNKQVLFLMLSLIAILFIIYAMEKQNKKINGLTFALSDLQSHLDKNQFTVQVALEEAQELGKKFKHADEVQTKDNIWGSKPEPIGSSSSV